MGDGSWSGMEKPEQFEPAKMQRVKDWSSAEMTDAQVDRAWEKQNSTEPVWAAVRASGFMAEACRRYLLKNPAQRAVRLVGTGPTAPSTVNPETGEIEDDF